MHGGGLGFGQQDEIANYAKILASKGYTAVGVDYSIAPGATYPTPLRQVMAAPAYLNKTPIGCTWTRRKLFWQLLEDLLWW